MFRGTQPTTVDDKSRIVIPARMREEARHIEGIESPVNFIMTVGVEDCIAIYTPSRWREVEAWVAAVPERTERARRYRRLFFSHAAPGDCDNQGRMRIPGDLLEAVGITRDAIVTGAGDHIELWDTARWAAYRGKMLSERVQDFEACLEAGAAPTIGGGETKNGAQDVGF